MPRRAASIVVAFGISLWAGALFADGLPDYSRESDLLVDTPGTTNSVAGGLLNPASWAMQRHALFLSWDDARGDLSRDAYTGVLSLRNLAFGIRQFQFEPTQGDPYRIRDYVLGVAGGNRTHTFGLSYGWGGGDLDREARHERFSLGSVTRCRFASLGVSWTRDLEVDDNFLQADLGWRPLGPRLTLFADAVYQHGQSFSDIATGWGVEYKVWSSLALAAKGNPHDKLSLRLTLALDPFTDLSWRPHFDSSDRVASTYAIETGALRRGFGERSLGRGRSYPKLSLRGRMAYQRYEFFDRRNTLLGTLDKIQAVADDARAGGIVIDLSGAELGSEMAWEIHAQLAALRARGKKVIVYMDRGNMSLYMLASVADQVWMDPQGGLDIRGLALGRTFVRHALDKAGVGVDEWRFFTYKSAFESFSRDAMSEPDREQRQALVDDFYDTMASMIVSGRGLQRADWDRLVNEKGVLLADEAQAAGLVDSIGGWERARQAGRAAARRPTGTGTAALLDGVRGDPVWGPQEWGEPPRIAVLYAIGPCEMDTGIRGRVLSRSIRKAREDRRVKAVVLRADSPGGDPLPSDLVAREILATTKRKPVIVSQGQVAGSGGYWISMYGDTILASPLTVTGSIGIIGGWLWNKELGDKIGLTYDGVKHGEHADLGTGIRLPLVGAVVPDRPLTPEERDRMEAIFRSEYRKFVEMVAKGRELDPERVDAIGQGRVWSGKRGRDLGLVDELGGLWRSVQIAKAAAGLDADRPIEFATGPEIGLFDVSRLKPKLFGTDAAVATDPSPLSPAELEYFRSLLRANGRPLYRMEPLEIRDGGVAP